MFEKIHARMQVKLARQGMSPDRETLGSGSISTVEVRLASLPESN
jgi:hypothetical protein